MILITVNDEKFISMVNTTSDLGDLGEATLVVDNKVQPKTLPCRKLALPIKPELYKLVDRGIRVPVTTPTRLVSQMAGSTKLMENWEFILIHKLSIQHYCVNTIKLQKAKLFSKLDIIEAYGHVKLDDRLSMLTTMITPFGRCRWSNSHLDWKSPVKSSREKLTDALGDIEGVFT